MRLLWAVAARFDNPKAKAHVLNSLKNTLRFVGAAQLGRYAPMIG